MAHALVLLLVSSLDAQCLCHLLSRWHKLKEQMVQALVFLLVVFLLVVITKRPALVSSAKQMA